MIALDFDTNEGAVKLDVHKWDKNIVLVAHNGYSYTRVVVPVEKLDELIEKLIQKKADETESI
jgi:hypothetical protein